MLPLGLLTSGTGLSLELIIGVLGAVGAVSVFFINKTSKARADGQWEGTVNQKLDTILDEFKTVKGDMSNVRETIHTLQHDVDELKKKLHEIERKKSSRDGSEL